MIQKNFSIQIFTESMPSFGKIPLLQLLHLTNTINGQSFNLFSSTSFYIFIKNILRFAQYVFCYFLRRWYHSLKVFMFCMFILLIIHALVYEWKMEKRREILLVPVNIMKLREYIGYTEYRLYHSNIFFLIGCVLWTRDTSSVNLFMITIWRCSRMNLFAEGKLNEFFFFANFFKIFVYSWVALGV